MKRLTQQQISGQRGVHIFSEKILGNGLSFHATGALDTGVDGFIELRDLLTSEVRAQYIAAQIKTTDALSEDDGQSFSYRVDARDLDYWLSSNAPLILAIVHLPTSRVYWKSIQHYFSNPNHKGLRKVVFFKRDDELTSDVVAKLTDLIASFARPGIVTPSLRVEETLEANLLKVSYPSSLRIASTELTQKQIRQTLLERRDYPPIDWIVHGGQIIAFRDLDDPLFRGTCDPGTIEEIGTREWFKSDGEVTKRQFVYLLGRCLSTKMQDQLTYYRSRKYFFFRAGRRRSVEKAISYRSFTNRTQRKVVSAHGKRQDGTGPAYYRHAAFFPRFIEIASEWYLAIEPTYHFTRDGFEEYYYSAERLAGIKLFETNANVRGHIGLWRSVLTERGDLLKTDYPYIEFETVSNFRISFGLPDELWTAREDVEDRKNREERQRELAI